MHSIEILHSSPPIYAISFVQAKEIAIPTETIYIDVGYVGNPAVRLEILQFARSAAVYAAVILYTSIPTSDHDSPCGCTGYDNVCDYHRHGEYEVAECFCSDLMKTRCSYHQS